ncbi:hypothetical protein RD792_014236 [Penstemon davidsonii]|uniref:Protein BIC1-like n=1 Tax=Penstemon davidsonii TaxID=160366 RepID=A0ABR0CQC9_9LAMI|nr:hypothetical protein RD792_014236 [Penstemon davidsonii]
MQKVVESITITMTPQKETGSMKTKRDSAELKTNIIDGNESNSIGNCEESTTVSVSACGDSLGKGASTTVPTKSEGTVEDVISSGRERLKRHRMEVAGRVWIPEMWGQENLLKDWIDCTAFDKSLVKSSIMSARAALVEEGRRPNSTRLRVENSC